MTLQDWLLIINTTAQVFTLIGLFIYVVYTAKMAKATKDQAEASQESLKMMRINEENQTRPYIVPYIDTLPNGMTHFVVVNTGKTPGINVKLAISPELVDDENFDPLHTPFKSLLANEISYMPPNYEMRILWEVKHKIPVSNIFEITVKYAGNKGAEYEERYRIKCDDDIGMLYQGRKPLQDIAFHLQNFLENLK